jgi:16S rRNA (adenine1518-N6/adenine1519-N6)-dimethyltransferase
MSLSQAERLIRKYGILPNKLLGQNFMIESSIFPLLADYASLSSCDVVLEAGAGFGFLTRFLSERCKLVIAVEKDCRVAFALRDQLSLVKNVRIVEGDVLRIDTPCFNKVVSIPPYQISSRLILWLFDHSFQSAVFILQEEFVHRISSQVGTDEYSWLTVFANYNARIQVLDAVPRTMFFPQPNVDSVIVQLTKKSKPHPKINNAKHFQQMLRFLFLERNKKVSNALFPFLKSFLHLQSEEAKTLISSLPFCEERVRTLQPENFGELANALSL